MNEPNAWRNVNRQNPCTICGKGDWCGYTETGWRQCHRIEAPGAIRKDGNDGGAYYYPPDGNARAPFPHAAPYTGAPLADPDTRDRVYRALMGKLRLSGVHPDFLTAKGMPPSEQSPRGYRTFPDDLDLRIRIAEALAQEFGEDTCAGVPGWCKRESKFGKPYPTLNGWAGLLIPELDAEGRYAALKVRSDKGGSNPDIPRYSYLSSASAGGPKAPLQAHRPLFTGSTRVARVTEGPLKADLATVLSGTLTLSIPGVSCWQSILPLLEAVQAQEVLLAFDMDAHTNRYVARALRATAEALTERGYHVGLETWDPRHKGIDDALLAGCEITIHRGQAMWSAIENLDPASPAPPPAGEPPPDDEQQTLDAIAGVPRAVRGPERSVPEAPAKGSKSQAERIKDLLLKEADLFHTPDGTPFATLRIKDHLETWPLSSKAVRGWIGYRFHQRGGSVPCSQATQDAFNTLSGIVQYDKPEYPVHTRIAKHNGKLYLHLADAEWTVLEIDGDGWRVCAQPPAAVRFRRPDGILPLPMPVRGGSLADLRPFVNVLDEEWPLFVGAQLMMFHPEGPYPLVEMRGEQGSAKSTTARVMHRNVDPNQMDLRVEPGEIRDLMVAAKNSHLIPYDNLSGVYPWLSDALCRLSTGGGMSKRKNFTDDDEIVFAAKRPVILTGIGGVATRSDLLDRTVLLNLPQITTRRDELQFWTDYEAARPRILGVLLDGVSMALRNLRHTRLPNLPRMADFALWVTAAEPALGWPSGTFLKCYQLNREEADAAALEASPIANLVRQLVILRYQQGDRPWEGTCEQLRVVLDSNATEPLKRRHNWPGTARALSTALTRIQPNLRAEGITLEELPRSNEGRRFRLLYSPPSPDSQKRNLSDGVSDGLSAQHANRHSDSVPALPFSDGSDGSDGSFLHESPAYIPSELEGEKSNITCHVPPDSASLEHSGEFASHRHYRHSGPNLLSNPEVINRADAFGFPLIQLPSGTLSDETTWRSFCSTASPHGLAEAWLALDQWEAGEEGTL